MAAITTESIALPTEVAQEIMRKAQNTSTIQTLSPSAPALFKNVEHLVGSFPRVRGAGLQRARPRPQGGIIPACAGSSEQPRRRFAV